MPEIRPDVLSYSIVHIPDCPRNAGPCSSCSKWILSIMSCRTRLYGRRQSFEDGSAPGAGDSSLSSPVSTRIGVGGELR